MASGAWRRLTRGDNILGTAVANACVPGVPAILLVLLGLLEPDAYGLMVPEVVPIFLPFIVGPLVLYSLWFLSRQRGWKWASILATLGAVALAVGALFVVLIMFLGLFMFVYGQGPLAPWVAPAAFVVSLATLASNLELFAKLDRPHQRKDAPGDRATDR